MRQSRTSFAFELRRCASSAFALQYTAKWQHVRNLYSTYPSNLTRTRHEYFKLKGAMAVQVLRGAHVKIEKTGAELFSFVPTTVGYVLNCLQ